MFGTRTGELISPGVAGIGAEGGWVLKSCSLAFKVFGSGELVILATYHPPRALLISNPHLYRETGPHLLFDLPRSSPRVIFMIAIYPGSE